MHRRVSLPALWPALALSVALIDPSDHALALRAELQPLFQALSPPTGAELAQAELRTLAMVSRAASPLTGSPLLIRTRVLNRSAELWQTVARWDGVSRPIAFHGAQPGRWSGEIVGSGPGISIEAVAVGPGGRFLMKHYGGIALPFAVTLTENRQPVLVPDPLSVPAQIREGVDIALAPLRGP